MAAALYALMLRRGVARWLAAVAVAPVLLDAYQLQNEQLVMPGTWFEVAGVVGNQRHNGLIGASRETIYMPGGLNGVAPASWVARVEGDAASFAEPMRAAVARADELVELARRNIQKSIALDAFAVQLRSV